jgi:hypothetical protein
MTSPFTVTSVEIEESPGIQARAIVQPRAQSNVVVLSSPMKVDLQVYRGDTGQFRLSVTDPNGNPVNLSGYTWDGDIRLKAADTAAVTSFTITPVVGDTSSVDVALTALESELLSGTMVYDIEMRKTGVVSTLIYGNITVTQDVSRP